MQKKIFFIVCCVFATFLVQSVLGQRLTRQDRIRGRKPPGRERLKCSTLIKLQKQKHAVGVHIGRPMALSLKSYNKSLWSYEVALGVSYGSAFSSASAIALFNGNKPENIGDVAYVSHDTKLPLMAQIKLVRHIPLISQIDNLMGYVSFGANISYSTLDVIYRDEKRFGSTTTISADVPTGFEVHAYTLDVFGIGPEIHVGLEYFFKRGLPLIAYVEVGGYYDVLHSAEEGLKPLGGAGFRFYF